jgi:hypothetical protein
VTQCAAKAAMCSEETACQFGTSKRSATPNSARQFVQQGQGGWLQAKKCIHCIPTSKEDQVNARRRNQWGQTVKWF